MNGWQLFTLLVVLLDTVALIYWQHANEKRLDLHKKQIHFLREQLQQLLPLLKHVSSRLEGTEIGNTEWKPADSKGETNAT